MIDTGFESYQIEGESFVFDVYSKCKIRFISSWPGQVVHLVLCKLFFPDVQGWCTVTRPGQISECLKWKRLFPILTFQTFWPAKVPSAPQDLWTEDLPPLSSFSPTKVWRFNLLITWLGKPSKKKSVTFVTLGGGQDRSSLHFFFSKT